MLASPGWNTTTKEGISSLECLNDIRVALSWYLRLYFTVELSGAEGGSRVREEGL